MLLSRPEVVLFLSRNDYSKLFPLLMYTFVTVYVDCDKRRGGKEGGGDRLHWFIYACNSGLRTTLLCATLALWTPYSKAVERNGKSWRKRGGGTNGTSVEKHAAMHCTNH